MSNLTLVIDDDLLRAARIKALQEGTSVNEVARQAIARFAGVAPKADDTTARLRELAVKMTRDAARRAGDGADWPSRDAMYDEALAERGKPVTYRTRD